MENVYEGKSGLINSILSQKNGQNRIDALQAETKSNCENQWNMNLFAFIWYQIFVTFLYIIQFALTLAY